jgi:hypothetical protein
LGRSVLSLDHARYGPSPIAKPLGNESTNFRAKRAPEAATNRSARPQSFIVKFDE